MADGRWPIQLIKDPIDKKVWIKSSVTIVPEMS
jgi:hypothetical protein